MGTWVYIQTLRSTVTAALRKGMMTMANSFKHIVIGFAINLIAIAILFSIIENRSFGDSVWWAIVTATTTGYGDITPPSFIGRTLAAELMLTSVIFFLPMIVVHLYDRYFHNKHQFSHAEQEWNMDSIQRLADAQGVALLPQPGDTEHGDVTTS